jgi:hypothetical protein
MTDRADDLAQPTQPLSSTERRGDPLRAALARAEALSDDDLWQAASGPDLVAERLPVRVVTD